VRRLLRVDLVHACHRDFAERPYHVVCHWEETRPGRRRRYRTRARFAVPLVAYQALLGKLAEVCTCGGIFAERPYHVVCHWEETRPGRRRRYRTRARFAVLLVAYQAWLGKLAEVCTCGGRAA
jgi:heme A synthase